MSDQVKRIQEDEFAVSPGGMYIGHTKVEVDYLIEIIEREKPQGFVEIGIYNGGLADTLIPKVPHYLGFEIDPQIIDKAVHNAFAANPNATLLIRNAWQDDTVWECVKWMQDKRPVFIYCDGGNKPVELYLYSKETRAGDLIGVHDYGTYEYAEILPNYADELMRMRGFKKYEPSFKPSLVRIAIWSIDDESRRTQN